jgi:predicted Zn-dependent peptidase
LINQKLQPGVTLHTQTTQQFATTQILINLAHPKLTVDVESRALAMNMLETVSAKYATQTKFAQALSSLYGASLDTYPVNVGGVHTLRISLTLVHDVFVEDMHSLLTEGLNFLREIMFNPLGNAQTGFDVTVFERQKEIALDEIAGMEEDKAYMAARHALQAYFDQPAFALPAFGSAPKMAQTTALSAWQAWFNALANDQIDIVVLGDVDDAIILAALQDWPWQAREIALDAYFQQPQKNTSLIINEQQAVVQARLVQIYDLKITREQRFAGYVFNALFGGLAISRLFMNVREKAGLAYSIYSDYNPFSATLLIEAGLEQNQLEQVQQLIASQLTNLQQQPITEIELAMIKRLLIADFTTSLDQPNRITERIVMQQIMQQTTSEAQWISAVNAVTINDVQMVSQQVVLQLTYALTEKDPDESIHASN